MLDGDERCVAFLYERYGARVHAFCRRVLSCPDGAADVTQDAFIKTLERLPEVGRDEGFNFQAYILTIARNLCYRLHTRSARVDLVDEIPERSCAAVAREPGHLDEDPERVALLGCLRSSVRQAHGRLSERQRHVLTLREVNELSYEEIAAAMAMNTNSVAQLISRSRARLRDELQRVLAQGAPDGEDVLAPALAGLR